MTIIEFANGRIPTVHSLYIPDGQVFDHLVLGDPYGSPSRGYRARVYTRDGVEVGTAMNQMTGSGWSVRVTGHEHVQAQYDDEALRKAERIAIYQKMEGLFPQYCGWKRYRSEGLIQSLIENVLTVNWDGNSIRAYWHKEDRWETISN